MRDKKVFRVLDVNLNRAREGIRVVEDSVRLIRDDAVMYRKLRRLRHALDETARQLYGSLMRARHVRGDVGRNMPAEAFRSPEDIIRANFRRSEESLRVLEEYARLFGRTKTFDFQRIRFKLYQCEKSYYARKA